MAIFIFEPRELRRRFYPLTRTRNLSDLQLGGYSIIDCWRRSNGGVIHVITEDYLQQFIPAIIEPGDILIHGSVFPGPVDWLFKQYPTEIKGVGLQLKDANADGKTDDEDQIMAVRVEAQLEVAVLRNAIFGSPTPNLALIKELEFQDISWYKTADLPFLGRPEALLSKQSTGIEMAVKFIEQNRSLSKSGSKPPPLDPSNQVKGDYPVILEEGASVSMAFLNTVNGPIYIGKDATVMEGAMIRGPLYLGERSTIKMGTRIYGPVVTGPDCVLGGEIKNVVFQRGSNKGHEGYLGDSIIGSWCNFGAGSGGSNVKNTAGPVRLYDYQKEDYRNVGSKFGAMVGDYSRIGVGTQLNTGSNIGVCCNLFGQEMPPKLVGDFSWGAGHNTSEYQVEKAISHIGSWLRFKQEQLTDKEIQILHHIFDQARKQV